MRFATAISVGLVGILAAACGGGLGGSYYRTTGNGSTGAGGGGGSGGGGGFSLGLGCLEVTNDAGGPFVLVAVQFLDVATHEVVREEAVSVTPTEDVDLMDVPAGPYEVVGVFDDGATDGSDPLFRHLVLIDPVIEATIAFRHP